MPCFGGESRPQKSTFTITARLFLRLLAPGYNSNADSVDCHYKSAALYQYSSVPTHGTNTSAHAWMKFGRDNRTWLHLIEATFALRIVALIPLNLLESRSKQDQAKRFQHCINILSFPPKFSAIGRVFSVAFTHARQC